MAAAQHFFHETIPSHWILVEHVRVLMQHFVPVHISEDLREGVIAVEDASVES